MDRRRYLLGTTALLAGSTAGCLSPRADRASGDDRERETGPDATLTEDVTPICPEDASIEGSLEEAAADVLTEHQFFRDAESGRYGVRGRIEPADGISIQSVRASFSDGSSESDRLYGFDPRETTLFTIVSSEGDPDAIDGYTLGVRTGETADVAPVPGRFVSIDGEWGRIGDSDGTPIYGYTAAVTNDHHRTVDLSPRVKTYLDETTVSHSGSGTESIGDLAPDETRTVSFPYPRCDHDEITDVDAWLEWSTMRFP